MQVKEIIYDHHDCAQQFTEIYSKDLTLTVEYTEGYESVKCLKEMTDLRFMASLKLPGHNPLQKCYSTLDILLLMRENGDNSFERYNLEENISSYLRMVRRNICEILPDIIIDKRSHMADSGSCENKDIEHNALKWDVLSPAKGNTFVFLKGDTATAEANIYKKFNPCDKLNTLSGVVIEIPHVEIHTVEYCKLLSCFN